VGYWPEKRWRKVIRHKGGRKWEGGERENQGRDKTVREGGVRGSERGGKGR